MRKLFYTVAAVAMAMASTAASATVVVANPAVLVPPASASYGSGQITNPAPGTPFSFSDQIQFTLGGASPALADSSLITFLLTGSQNISFACQTCSLFLDNNVDGFRFVQTQFDPMAEAWQLNPIAISPGLHTIFANGVLFGPTGSYGGTINVQAIPNVPEPATWAMMLLGFGAIGWQLRRRRPVLAQAA
jgi:PEP-CTERM motif